MVRELLAVERLLCLAMMADAGEDGFFLGTELDKEMVQGSDLADAIDTFLRFIQTLFCKGERLHKGKPRPCSRNYNTLGSSYVAVINEFWAVGQYPRTPSTVA